MEHARDDIIAWLKGVIERAGPGETASSIARRAGLATTTLTRFLSDADAPILGSRSIAKIAHATGEAPPGMGQVSPINRPIAAGLAEREASPYASPSSPSPDAAISALIDGRNSADAWTLHTDALLLAGYLPGDIVIVDLAAAPKRGDVVCAQVYRWRQGEADTVFRIYEPPYLVAASAAPALRMPLVADDERVVIKGVVTDSLRRRAV